MITTIASTVPANGDINPYGIVVVPRTTGKLVQGNLLISNFNASSNFQGTGTTIVQISSTGQRSQFARINADHLPGTCTGGVGLTTALAVLRSGWVIVGSLPTTDGTSATAQAGCLLVLNSSGRVVETIFGTLINGPWDMTALDLSTPMAPVVPLFSSRMCSTAQWQHMEASYTGVPSFESISLLPLAMLRSFRR